MSVRAHYKLKSGEGKKDQEYVKGACLAAIPTCRLGTRLPFVYIAFAVS